MMEGRSWRARAHGQAQRRKEEVEAKEAKRFARASVGGRDNDKDNDKDSYKSKGKGRGRGKSKDKGAGADRDGDSEDRRKSRFSLSGALNTRRFSLAPRMLAGQGQKKLTAAGASLLRLDRISNEVCSFRPVSVAFLVSFTTELELDNLAPGVKLFEFKADFQAAAKKGQCGVLKRRLSQKRLLLSVNGADVLVDSVLVRCKDRANWTMADVCRHVVQAPARDREREREGEGGDLGRGRGSGRGRDQDRDGPARPSGLLFNDVIAQEAPEALGKPFQGAYVSYARTTRFKALVKAIVLHFAGRNADKTFVWLDLFGAVQWSDESDADADANVGSGGSSASSSSCASVSSDLSDGGFGDSDSSSSGFGDSGSTRTSSDLRVSSDLREMRSAMVRSGLHRALRHFSEVLLFVASWDDPAPLRRAWCLWELYGAAVHHLKFSVVSAPDEQQLLPARLRSEFPHMMSLIAQVDVRRAAASSPSELALLLAAVDGKYKVKRTRGDAANAAAAAAADPAAAADAATSAANRAVGCLLLDWITKALQVAIAAQRRELRTSEHHLKLGQLVSNEGVLLLSKGRLDDAADRFRSALKAYAPYLGDDDPRVLDVVLKIEQVASLRAQAKKRGPGSGSGSGSDSGSGSGSGRDGAAGSGAAAVAVAVAAATAAATNADGARAGEMEAAASAALAQSARERMNPRDSDASHGSNSSSSSNSNSNSSNSNSSNSNSNSSSSSSKAKKKAKKKKSKKKGQALGGQHNAAMLHNDACELVRAGKQDEAYGTFVSALHAFRRASGSSKDHVLAAKTLSNMGSILDEEGHFAQALERYREALEIRRDHLGDIHADVAAALGNVARVQAHMGESNDALDSYASALRITDQQDSDVDAKARDVKVALLRGVGAVMLQVGDHDSALDHLEEAIEVLDAGNPDATDVAACSRKADVLGSLAQVLCHMGLEEEALVKCEEALALQLHAHGNVHVKVADCIFNLGAMLDDQGDRSRASAKYKEALSMFKATVGRHHPRVADTHYNLGAVLLHQRRYEEALDHYRCAIAIFRRVDHPHTALALNNVAVVLSAQGRLDEAYVTGKAALDLFERNLGAGHPHTERLRGKLQRLARKRNNAPSS